MLDQLPMSGQETVSVIPFRAEPNGSNFDLLRQTNDGLVYPFFLFLFATNNRYFIVSSTGNASVAYGKELTGGIRYAKYGADGQCIKSE